MSDWDPWEDGPQRYDQAPYGDRSAGAAGHRGAPADGSAGLPSWNPWAEANARRPGDGWDVNAVAPPWESPQDSAAWGSQQNRRPSTSAVQNTAAWGWGSAPWGSPQAAARPDSERSVWDDATVLIPRPRTPSDVELAEDVEAELDDPEPGYAGALAWTVGWYIVPTTLYLLWILTLSGSGCAGTVGAACQARRTHVTTALVDQWPWLALALAVSLLVAAAIRRATTEWRGATTGFAATAIGCGLTTLVFSALVHSAG